MKRLRFALRVELISYIGGRLRFVPESEARRMIETGQATIPDEEKKHRQIAALLVPDRNPGPQGRAPHSNSCRTIRMETLNGGSPLTIDDGIKPTRHIVTGTGRTHAHIPPGPIEHYGLRVELCQL